MLACTLGLFYTGTRVYRSSDGVLRGFYRISTGLPPQGSNEAVFYRILQSLYAFNRILYHVIGLLVLFL